MKIVAGSNFPILLQDYLLLCNYKDFKKLRSGDILVKSWYITDDKYRSLKIISDSEVYETSSKIMISQIQNVKHGDIITIETKGQYIIRSIK